MSHTACQCARWPEQCWASHAGTRGLCTVCMPGNCARPRPVTSDHADVTHRTPGAGWSVPANAQSAGPAASSPASHS